MKGRAKVKYYYPAVFERKKNSKGFVITIPDIHGCHTQGDDMEECMWMAHEAIGCMLEDVEEKDYPQPSKIKDIDLGGYEPDSFKTSVTFDKEQYNRDTLVQAAMEKISRRDMCSIDSCQVLKITCAECCSKKLKIFVFIYSDKQQTRSKQICSIFFSTLKKFCQS